MEQCRICHPLFFCIQPSNFNHRRLRKFRRFHFLFLWPKTEKIPKVSLLIPLTAFFFKRTRVLVFYKLIVLGKSEISKNIAVLWSFFTKVASCGPAWLLQRTLSEANLELSQTSTIELFSNIAKKLHRRCSTEF